MGNSTPVKVPCTTDEDCDGKKICDGQTKVCKDPVLVTGWNSLFAVIAAIVAPIIGWMLIGSNHSLPRMLQNFLGKAGMAPSLPESIAKWIIWDMLIKTIFVYGPILFGSAFIGLMVSMSVGCHENYGFFKTFKQPFLGIAAKNAFAGPITALIAIIVLEILTKVLCEVVPPAKIVCTVIYGINALLAKVVNVISPIKFVEPVACIISSAHIILLLILNTIFGGVVGELAANVEACKYDINGNLKPAFQANTTPPAPQTPAAENFRGNQRYNRPKCRV